MSWLLYLAGGGVGFLLAGMFLIQPCIAIFFRLPFAKRLIKLGVLEGENAVHVMRVQTLNLFAFLILSAAIIVAMIFFAAEALLTGFWFGVGTNVLLAIPRFGMDGNNVADFLELHIARFNQERWDEVEPVLLREVKAIRDSR